MQKGSLFSSIYCLYIYFYYYYGHSDEYKVIFHWSFNLHFFNNEWCWASFHVFISHLYVFFAHFLIGLFVFLALSYINCLYIFEINPLSVVSFAIIFFSFWGFSFNLVYSFLWCATASKFYKVPFVYFCFYFCYYRIWVIEDLAVIYVIECSAYVFL